MAPSLRARAATGALALTAPLLLLSAVLSRFIAKAHLPSQKTLANPIDDTRHKASLSRSWSSVKRDGRNLVG